MSFGFVTCSWRSRLFDDVKGAVIIALIWDSLSFKRNKMVQSCSCKWLVSVALIWRNALLFALVLHDPLRQKTCDFLNTCTFKNFVFTCQWKRHSDSILRIMVYRKKSTLKSLHQVLQLHKKPIISKYTDFMPCNFSHVVIFLDILAIKWMNFLLFAHNIHFCFPSTIFLPARKFSSKLEKFQHSLSGFEWLKCRLICK